MTNDVFLVGGWDRFRAVSDDGIHWRHTNFSEKETLMCSGIADGGGRCAMLYKRGYFGKCILDVSPDGKDWQEFEVDAKQVGHSLVYFGGQFLVCTGKTINSGHRPEVVLTEDGSQWSQPIRVGGRSIMTHYAQGNDRLVGVGPSGMAAMTTDARQWKVADLKISDSMISLTFGNGRFVGGGLHGQAWISHDGLIWEKVNQGDEGEHLNTMIWTGENFVGIGLGATYFSDDGRSWQRVANEDAPLTAVRNDRGLYLGTQWKGRILSSDDGIAWKEQATLARHVESIACVNLT